MIPLRTLITFLESVAPPHLQAEYDNSGLIVGDPEKSVRSALICLDSTDAVIREAIAHDCDLVIAHHPIIFRGLKRLTGANYVERAVMEAIKHDIAIYAMHTNLDHVLTHGVNGRIARRLGLTGCRILSPTRVEGDTGAGLIGNMPDAMPESAFLAHLGEVMAAGVIKHTALLGRPVRRVAVCGGSGRFLLDAAIEQHADIYISADFKYHDYFDADGRIVIADIGHYESEQFTMPLLFDLVTEKFPNFAARLTQINTNPITYLVHQNYGKEDKTGAHR